jgi:hypothetical protein
MFEPPPYNRLPVAFARMCRLNDISTLKISRRPRSSTLATAEVKRQ